MTQLSMTAYVRADRLQLSWQNTAELTDCGWSDMIEGRAAKEVTLCSSADWMQPSQVIAGRLKSVEIWQPSWKNAAQLTSRSQSRQIAKSAVWSAAVNLQLSWQAKAGLTDCRDLECVQLDSLSAPLHTASWLRKAGGLQGTKILEKSLRLAAVWDKSEWWISKECTLTQRVQYHRWSANGCMTCPHASRWCVADVQQFCPWCVLARI